MGGAVQSDLVSRRDSAFSFTPQLADVCNAVSSSRKSVLGPPRLYVEFIPKDELELKRDVNLATTEELSLNFRDNLQYLKELDHGLEYSTKGLVFWVTLYCEDIARKVYFDLVRGVLQEDIQSELNRKAVDMGLPYTVIFSDWWLDSGGPTQEETSSNIVSRDTSVVDSFSDAHSTPANLDSSRKTSLRRPKITSDDTEETSNLTTGKRQDKQQVQAEGRLKSMDETPLLMDSKKFLYNEAQSDRAESIEKETRLSECTGISEDEKLHISQTDAEDSRAPQTSSSTDIPPAGLAGLEVRRCDYAPGDLAVPADYATQLQRFLAGYAGFSPEPQGLNTMSPYHFSEVGFLHSPTNSSDALHTLGFASRLEVALNDKERPVLLQPDGNIAFVSVGVADASSAHGPGGAFWLPAHLPLIDMMRDVLKTDRVKLYSSNFLDESRKCFVSEAVTASECVSSMKPHDLLYMF